MQISRHLLLALFLFLGSFAIAQGKPENTDTSTLIRNGGDVLLTRLQMARVIMGQAVSGLLKEDPKTSRYSCLSGRTNIDELCRAFLLEVASQVNNLDGSNVSLVLVQAPISVKDPFTGADNFVAARTVVDHNGPIEFHIDSLKTMDMPEVVFLLSHEFMHKVKYKGKFITDDAVYPTMVGGRSIIDSLASTIKKYAMDHGFLGRFIAIQFNFSCKIKTPTSQTGADFKLNRVDYPSNSISGGFRVTLGDDITDPHLYFYSDDDSRIEFRFRISNMGLGSCDQRTGIKAIRMQLVQSTKRPDGTYTDSIIKTSSKVGSPLCSEQDPTFSLSHEDKTFTCTYAGAITRQN